ncbi:MAG: hypothetical protein ACI4XJ_05905 [Eubacteriales bacterium]
MNDEFEKVEKIVKEFCGEAVNFGMKKEIEKKIKELCDEAGSAAAAEICPDLTEDIERAYDERIAAGMSELDAYRDVLRNVDDIKKMLDSMPLTEDEERGRRTKDSRKYSEKLLDKICTSLWLLVVIVYLLFSLTFGGWRYTWLIFLWGAIGQTFFDMLKKYNRGTPLKKVLRKGISAIMWLAITMAYFVFSFATGKWAVTWIIFIFGALLENVINIFCKE